MAYEQLKLDNQVCFPIYAASRLITRAYLPHLDRLGITYPQYLVLLVLWETNGLSVNEITRKLILNTNTITPLLKRMEKMGLVSRTRSSEDERKVIVELTESGHKMKLEAAEIPIALSSKFMDENLNVDDILALKEKMCTIVEILKQKDTI